MKAAAMKGGAPPFMAQAVWLKSFLFFAQIRTMAPRAKAPAMKAAAMKGGAAMSKAGLVAALIGGTEVKGSVCKQLLEKLATVATKEVKGSGKFTIPGLCLLKIRNKPATKAGKKEGFGKVVMVKAKPASKVVKAYCVAALKGSGKFTIPG